MSEMYEISRRRYEQLVGERDEARAELCKTVDEVTTLTFDLQAARAERDDALAATAKLREALGWMVDNWYKLTLFSDDEDVLAQIERYRVLAAALQGDTET